MVYAADSKSAAFTGLRVQVSSPALAKSHGRGSPEGAAFTGATTGPSSWAMGPRRSATRGARQAALCKLRYGCRVGRIARNRASLVSAGRRDGCTVGRNESHRESQRHHLWTFARHRRLFSRRRRFDRIRRERRRYGWHRWLDRKRRNHWKGRNARSYRRESRQRRDYRQWWPALDR
jgi:hypothetical protein